MNTFTRLATLTMTAAVASVIAAQASFANDAFDRAGGHKAAAVASAFAAETRFASNARDGASDREAAAEADADRAFRNARLAQPAGYNALTAQLVTDVNHGLRGAGINDVDPAMLSVGTNLRLSQVFSDHERDHYAQALAILDEAPRRARLMRTVAEVPASADQAAIVVRDLRSRGIDVSDPGMLTLGQLSRISSELDQSGDGAPDQAAAIRKILGM